jgi:pimeloyl-ACP methyl ester carboxylesterase
MPSFSSNSVEIAYEEAGEGDAILLIHGFASNSRVNWWDTGWVKFLAASDFRVVTIDNRGHGESQALYDPNDYSAPIMAEDAYRLLDHLGISKAHVMGYSMGARITAFLTLNHAERVRTAVLAGLAANMIQGFDNSEQIAQALEAPTSSEIADPAARAFRVFAEQTRSDRKALAACMRSSRQKITMEELGHISVPVLVVAGEIDDISGPIGPLVTAIPGAKGVTLPHRNHMNAVGDKLYKAAVLEFLRSKAA